MSDRKTIRARAPQRSNGVRRREEILDAAAGIISESGLAGLSLHATARRAGSSIGSMYHFFADKDQLLDALRDRHRAAMDGIMADVSTIPRAQWTAMSASEVIGALFGRPIQFYSDHPFALEILPSHEGRAVDEFRDLLENVMRYRLGDSRGSDVAKMLFAISTGTLSFALDMRNAGGRALVPDIPSVLAAYLEKQEALAASQEE